MRKTIWYSVLAASLALGGAACKKDNSKITDEQGSTVRKAQEDVKDQKEDLRDDMKDVQKDVDDVHKQTGDVATAEASFVAARTAYTTAVGQRLAKLDEKLAELDVKAAPEAKTRATALHGKREALDIKLRAMTNQTESGWSDFTKDIDSSFDAIEHDVYDALDDFK